MSGHQTDVSCHTLVYIIIYILRRWRIFFYKKILSCWDKTVENDRLHHVKWYFVKKKKKKWYFVRFSSFHNVYSICHKNITIVCFYIWESHTFQIWKFFQQRFIFGWDKKKFRQPTILFFWNFFGQKQR